MKWEELLVPKRFEELSEDVRPFQRDFDAISSCSAFRRLQDKAQVFPMERWDFARTRLTHSIETMAVADTIGNIVVDIIRLKYKNRGDTVPKDINHIPVLLRSAALLHDIGNPPFGHLGEEALSHWFEKNLRNLYLQDEGVIFVDAPPAFANTSFDAQLGDLKTDFLRFDGNAQLLRLVTKLQDGSGKANGMNFTYPLLATIVKYPTATSEVKTAGGKAGFFTSEKEIYNAVSTHLNLSGKRHPLTYLLEASDDIAYITADFEDSCRKNLFDFPFIEQKITAIADNNNSINEIKKSINEITISVGLDENSTKIHLTVSIIRRIMIGAVCKAFEDNYDDIMAGRFNGDLISSSEVCSIKELFKEVMKEKVYHSSYIIRTKIQAHKILETLFRTFIPCIFSQSTKNKFSDDSNSLLYKRISDNFRSVCENAIKNKTDELTASIHDKNEREPEIKRWIIYYRLLLVTDYISGMTDRYARDMYKLIMSLDQ